MDGEIITSGEMQEAMKLSTRVQSVMTRYPDTVDELTDVANFLASVAWKGMKH